MCASKTKTQHTCGKDVVPETTTIDINCKEGWHNCKKIACLDKCSLVQNVEVGVGIPHAEGEVGEII